MITLYLWLRSWLRTRRIKRAIDADIWQNRKPDPQPIEPISLEDAIRRLVEQ